MGVKVCRRYALGVCEWSCAELCRWMPSARSPEAAFVRDVAAFLRKPDQRCCRGSEWHLRHYFV